MRGKDKGETGVVKRVIRSQNRVIVEGKNLVNLTSLHCTIRQIVFISYLNKWKYDFVSPETV